MKRLLILVLIGSVGCGTTWAAGQDRGGGKGVVCRSPQGQIESVELLDLWEARELFHKTEVASFGNLKDDLDAALGRAQNILAEEDYQRLDGSLFKSGEDAIKQLQFISFGIVGFSNFSRMERLRGVNLPLTPDSYEGNLNLKPGCQVEQVVVFIRPHTVGSYAWQINMDLFDKMNSVQQSALALHEAIYSLLGTYSFDGNSLRVRRATSFVMTGGAFSEITTRLQKPYIRCATQTLAREVGLSTGPGDPRDAYLNRVLTGFVYFAHTSPGKVSMVVDNIRGSRLIDFNQPRLLSSDISFAMDLRSFFLQLTQSEKQIHIVAAGSPQDVEFGTQVDFQIQWGVATVSKTKVTGGGFFPAPVGNLHCTWIP